MSENAYEQRAAALLRGLGIQRCRRGYAYLVCAAALTTQSLAEQGALPETLYFKVAERCGATPAAVERTMRNTVAALWRKRDPAVRKKRTDLWGRERPSNAAFVRLLAEKLLQNW